MKILVYGAQKLQGGQVVNKLGKYLYNHIDSAYRINNSANMVDVYFTVYYQLKEELRTESDKDMKVMSLYINLTTYSDKIRMNIVEISPREKTLGFNTFSINKFEDLSSGYTLVMNTVKKRLAKEYQDYDFLF